MENIFLFTASGAIPRKHMRDTIENPIPREKVERHFSGEQLTKLKKIGQQQGYYAWGALPGPKNSNTWDAMTEGDHILCYQNGNYTYYSKVALKFRNQKFAQENWGSDEGNTWELAYFLDKPTKLLPPADFSKLKSYLFTNYMGFSKLSVDKINKILSEYKTIDNFIDKVLKAPKPPLKFWWVCQGSSYQKAVASECLWAPYKDRSGGTRYHLENIRMVKKGDIIINYSNGAIRALSIAKDIGYDFENDDSEWNKDGTRVDIEHYNIENMPIVKLKDDMEQFRNALQEIQGPFDINGDVKQGYLFEFNFYAAKLVREIYGKPFPYPIEKLFDIEPPTPTPVIKNEILSLLLKKRQIILYGPPGTGKTFRTKKLALHLLEGNFSITDLKSMDINKRCFKIDKPNAYAMLQGFKKAGTINYQSIWVDVAKKPFPSLITLNRSNTKFRLSSLGKSLKSENYSFPLKYIALLDSEYFIRNEMELWETICSNGLFDIWNPSAPYSRLAESNSDPLKYRIHLLRIYEISESFNIKSIIHKTHRIDHISSKKLNVTIKKPVVSDPEFALIKTLLKKSVSKFQL